MAAPAARFDCFDGLNLTQGFSSSVPPAVMEQELVPRYTVISPVRDEEQFVEVTIESLVGQTLRPAEYIIVDDGSTDRTGAIIDGYAGKYPWIRAVHRSNRGFRKPGGGVIEAFYAGFNALACADWDFLVKLDGDLSFGPTYFEELFRRFQDNPKLGLAGGGIYHFENGAKVLEKCPVFHVRGATKVYRRECWQAIGGLWTGPGWDAIDELKADMLGWSSRSFLDLELVQHRFTGAASGRWNGAVKDGRADYACGYHPLYLLAKCCARLARRPYIVGSLALLYGYMTGYFKRLPRVDDRQFIRHVRAQQMARLLHRPTIWK